MPRLLLRALLAVPALLLIWAGYVHFQDGIAVDSAIPVNEYLTRQVSLPASFYTAAAQSLSRANSRNGNARIVRAEAAMHGGEKPARQVERLLEGLQQSPANARGWMLLSHAAQGGGTALAMDAYSQSILLSHYDYWLAGPRLLVGSELWPKAGPDVRRQMLAQVHLVWETPELRGFLMPLLFSKNGSEIVSAAFSGDPAEFRLLNRFISSQNRLQAGGKNGS